MHQALVFRRVPRDVCEEGKAPDADEERARRRARFIDVLLRQTPPRTSSLNNTIVLQLISHPQPEQQELRLAALSAEEHSQSHPNPPSSTAPSKSARAYAKTYHPGPPLVPALVIQRIMHYTGTKLKLRKKLEFVQQLARYWSLKREARRGAPLLKRLHLEPWTIVGLGAGQGRGEEERGMRVEVGFFHLSSFLCFFVVG